MLAALQASDLPKAIGAVLNTVNAATATQDQITKVLTLAAAWQTVLALTAKLPVELQNKLTGLLTGTPENTAQIVAFAAAFSIVGAALKANPVADVLKAIATQAAGAYGALGQASDALKGLLKTYDGSTAATVDITKATVGYYNALLAAIGQIEQIKTAIKDMFQASIRTIQLQVMTPEQKAAFYTQDMNAANRLIAATSDPATINALAARWNADKLAAFNLLSPAQQLSQASAYEAAMAREQTLVTARLNAVEKTMVAAAHTMMTEVYKNMKNAVDTMVKAANTEERVANTNLAAAKTPINVRVIVDRSGGIVNVGAGPG